MLVGDLTHQLASFSLVGFGQLPEISGQGSLIYRERLIRRRLFRGRNYQDELSLLFWRVRQPL